MFETRRSAINATVAVGINALFLPGFIVSVSLGGCRVLRGLGLIRELAHTAAISQAIPKQWSSDITEAIINQSGGIFGDEVSPTCLAFRNIRLCLDLTRSCNETCQTQLALGSKTWIPLSPPDPPAREKSSAMKRHQTPEALDTVRGNLKPNRAN